jgi:hypothetical protein
MPCKLQPSPSQPTPNALDIATAAALFALFGSGFGSVNP